MKDSATVNRPRTNGVLKTGKFRTSRNFALEDEILSMTAVQTARNTEMIRPDFAATIHLP
jgi:hypothetical protein